MVRYDDIKLFVRTAALGSFSGAAREAGLLPGQASAAVKRLEDELGVRLFARSTRSLRLTAEGERFLPSAAESLDRLREGQERLRVGNSLELAGTLWVSAPSDMGRNILLPWLSKFAREHPALSLRLSFSDQVADVFRDPVDVAIRLGTVPDATYVALPLAPDNRRVLTAAPSYLDTHGRPRTIHELSEHACLVYTLGGAPYDKWRFPTGEQTETVAVRSAIVADDADVARRLAVAGHGILYKSWLDVRQDVLAGRLEIILPGQRCEAAPVSMICPHRKQFSPAIRRLHAVLRDHFVAFDT